MDHLTEAEELIYSLALGNPLPDRATGGGRASPFTCAAPNPFNDTCRQLPDGDGSAVSVFPFFHAGDNTDGE